MRQILFALGAGYLTLHHVERLEYIGQIFGQRFVLQLVGNVQKRAVDVRGNQAEDSARFRGKALDAHAPVDKNRGNVGRGDEVLQVIIDLAGFINLDFQFKIDRRQFLVDGLEFFFAGLKLLAGRTQLFIDGLQLFIRRLDLFGRCFSLLYGFLQMLFELLDFTFQLIDQQLLNRVSTL